MLGRDLDLKTDYNGVFAEPAEFAKKVHVLWLGVGTAEAEGMRAGIRKLHASFTEAGIAHVYQESPGTDHEWQTWRRNLYDFARDSSVRHPENTSEFGVKRRGVSPSDSAHGCPAAERDAPRRLAGGPREPHREQRAGLHRPRHHRLSPPIQHGRSTRRSPAGTCTNRASPARDRLRRSRAGGGRRVPRQIEDRARRR